MSLQRLHDEKRLLTLLAQGSEFAYIQLYNEYRPQIYRTALRFLDTREQAEEVVQEVFMDVWLRRTEMTNILNFKPFIYAMVRNQVHKVYRHQVYVDAANEEFSRIVNIDQTTDKEIVSQEYEKLLTDAVQQLSQIQRKVFTLAREEHLSHKEIATRLDLTTLSVKSHMKRALHSIRKFLKPHIGSGLFLIIGLFCE